MNRPEITENPSLYLPESPTRIAEALIDQTHPMHTQITIGMIDSLAHKIQTGRVSLETMDVVLEKNATSVGLPDSIDRLIEYDLDHHKSRASTFIERVQTGIREQCPDIFIIDQSTVGRENLETFVKETIMEIPDGYDRNKFVMITDSLNPDRLDSSNIDHDATTVEGLNLKEILDSIADSFRRKEEIQTRVTVSFTGWKRDDPEAKKLESIILQSGFSLGGNLDLTQQRLSNGEHVLGITDQIDTLLDKYLTEVFGKKSDEEIPHPQLVTFTFGEIDSEDEKFDIDDPLF